MNKKSPLVEYNSTSNQVNVVLKKETPVYLDEFMRLHKICHDLVDNQLFPNAKEVSESFGCYNAARKYLKRNFAPDDPSVVLVAVGDGTTPRTAATFAFRTAWQCYSVDPLLKPKEYPNIDRLTVLRQKIEDVPPQIFGNPDKVVIVACHSHANLPNTISALRRDDKPLQQIAVIALPCCKKQELDVPPDREYTDWGVWSPKKDFRIWHDVVAKRYFSGVSNDVKSKKTCPKDKTSRDCSVDGQFGWLRRVLGWNR